MLLLLQDSRCELQSRQHVGLAHSVFPRHFLSRHAASDRLCDRDAKRVVDAARRLHGLPLCHAAPAPVPRDLLCVLPGARRGKLQRRSELQGGVNFLAEGEQWRKGDCKEVLLHGVVL